MEALFDVYRKFIDQLLRLWFILADFCHCWFRARGIVKFSTGVCRVRDTHITYQSTVHTNHPSIIYYQFGHFLFCWSWHYAESVLHWTLSEIWPSSPRVFQWLSDKSTWDRSYGMSWIRFVWIPVQTLISSLSHARDKLSISYFLFNIFLSLLSRRTPSI